MDEKALSESAWKRGWQDTKTALGGWRFWALEVFGGGLIAMWEPLTALIFVAGMVGVLWIACTVKAPMQQRNDARVVLKEQAEKIKTLETDAPKLECDIPWVSYCNPKDEESDGIIVVWCIVRNTGSRPSDIAATGVSVNLGGEVKKLEVIHPVKGITTDTGRHPPENALYESGIIQDGGRAAGYLAAKIAPREYERLTQEHGEVIVFIRDVRNVLSTCALEITKDRPGGDVKYIPGLRPQGV